MTPFQELGVPANCSIGVAKAAYRRLAQQHHPDKGGVEAKFKAIKAAWETIEGGYYEANIQPGPTAKSSFTEPPAKPKQANAGKPAPGYEARKTAPILPYTFIKRVANARQRDYAVELKITENQAFEGCVVPFWHDGNVLEYLVRPGTSSRIEKVDFPRNPMIGSSHLGNTTIEVQLTVLPECSTKEELPADAEMEVPLCALGLFTGGKVTIKDHLGDPVSISIPAGYNPIELIKIPGSGYGPLGNRGTLIVRIVPIFKVPSALNQHEHKQLQRLNEMSS